MTTRKTTTAKATSAKDVKATPAEAPQNAQVEAPQDAPAEATQAQVEAPQNAQVADQYPVIVCSEDTRITKIVLRDNPSVEDDNDALIVPVGTKLRAVEDMGEWTKLTHDLFIMSKFVKKL
mgnify:CR=1 FL=1